MKKEKQYPHMAIDKWLSPYIKKPTLRLWLSRLIIFIPALVIICAAYVIFPLDENRKVEAATEITLYPNLKKQLEKEMKQYNRPLPKEDDEDEKKNIATAAEIKLSVALETHSQMEALYTALVARGVEKPEQLVLADLNERFADQRDYIANWEKDFESNVYLGSRALYEDTLKYGIYREALRTYLREELQVIYGEVSDEQITKAVRDIVFDNRH